MSCGWEGDQEKVIQAPSPDNPLGVALEISAQYFQQLHELAAKQIGIAMVRAGVVGGQEDPADLGRIIKAAVTGAHTATLETIELIQQEKSSGRN
jgi:hypothetical protein